MKLTKSKLRKMIKEELLSERELEADLQTAINLHFDPLRKSLTQYARQTTDPKWKKIISVVMRNLDKIEDRAAYDTQRLGIIPLK